jgi:uncharacterized protein (DUF169 family)
MTAAISEYNRYGTELESFLLLKTSPLAIKMLEKESDIPAGTFRPKKDRGQHLAQCQALALSRRRRLSVTMLKEDHWCWGPLVGYGLVDPQINENEEVIKSQGKMLPQLAYGKYIGMVSAPLKSANFEPDLIMVYSNTAQLRNILMSVKLNEGNLISSQFDPIDSCVYAVVPTLLTGEYRITLPDPGDHQRAMAGEDEIIFSLPKEKLTSLVLGLRACEQREPGLTYEKFEMRPDFPQPDFYQRLFRGWGLDKPA